MTRGLRYDYRATIYRNSPTRSTSGAVIDSWAPIAQRWVAVAFRSGREFIAAYQINAEIEALFVLRCPVSGLTSKDRIQVSGLVYDILYVDTLTDPRKPRLAVKAGKAAI